MEDGDGPTPAAREEWVERREENKNVGGLNSGEVQLPNSYVGLSSLTGD